jgi:hypothetical protein
MLARKWFLTSLLSIATGRWTARPAEIGGYHLDLDRLRSQST